MTRRRDFVLGGMCVAALAGAYALRPHRRVRLLGDVTLAQIVPAQVGAWSAQSDDNLVAPAEAGTLASQLYSETLGRLYVHAPSGAQIMMLLAYGPSQTEQLQLHRPEICYPAFGFSILRSEPRQIPIGRNVNIPGRRLYAAAAERNEALVYWSRLGEYMPQDHDQQRTDRLRTAMEGYVGDGVLARFSAVGDAGPSWSMIEGFIPQFISAIPSAHRQALVGSTRARALA